MSSSGDPFEAPLRRMRTPADAVDTKIDLKPFAEEKKALPADGIGPGEKGRRICKFCGAGGFSWYSVNGRWRLAKFKPDGQPEFHNCTNRSPNRRESFADRALRESERDIFNANTPPVHIPAIIPISNTMPLADGQHDEYDEYDEY